MCGPPPNRNVFGIRSGAWYGFCGLRLLVSYAKFLEWLEKKWRYFEGLKRCQKSTIVPAIPPTRHPVEAVLAFCHMLSEAGLPLYTTLSRPFMACVCRERSLEHWCGVAWCNVVWRGETSCGGIIVNYRPSHKKESHKNLCVIFQGK